MKLYCVTVPGRSWTMTAPNIQAASQFVKHCPSVRLRTICPMVLDIEVATGAGLDALAQFAGCNCGGKDRQHSAECMIFWAPTHVALVNNPPDPNCRWCGESEHARGGACVALDHG